MRRYKWFYKYIYISTGTCTKVQSLSKISKFTVRSNIQIQNIYCDNYIFVKKISYPPNIFKYMCIYYVYDKCMFIIHYECKYIGL